MGVEIQDFIRMTILMSWHPVTKQLIKCNHFHPSCLVITTQLTCLSSQNKTWQKKYCLSQSGIWSFLHCDQIKNLSESHKKKLKFTNSKWRNERLQTVQCYGHCTVKIFCCCGDQYWNYTGHWAKQKTNTYDRFFTVKETFFVSFLTNLTNALSPDLDKQNQCKRTMKYEAQ